MNEIKNTASDEEYGDVGIESPINPLIEQISDNVDKHMLDNLKNIGKEQKDERTGRIGYLYSEALAKSNVAWYKDMFYWFNGDIYTQIVPASIKHALTEAMRRDGVAYEDITKRQSIIVKPAMEGTINRVLKPRPDLIAFKNCALDISKMEKVPISPKIPIITRLGYDFDPSAKCPMWENFLMQVLPNEIDRINFQEFVGMIFINRKRVKIEKMCLMLGNGSNGKSVAGGIIQSMLGRENVSNLDLSSLMDDGDAAAKAISGIDGKMLNYNSELDKGELKGSGFKRIISGEATMARVLYKNSYKLENIPLFMACANEMPYTKDKSDGFYRRLLILNFSVKITDEMKDHELEQKIEKELSGVFNWAVVGRDRFIKRGFKMTENEGSARMVAEYKIEQSTELSFLRNHGYMPLPCYANHQPQRKGSTDLLREYTKDCRDTNRPASSDRTFWATLANEGYDKIRTSEGYKWIYYQAPLYSEWKDYVGFGKTTMTESEWLDMIEWKIKPIGGFSAPAAKKQATQSEIKFKPEPIREPEPIEEIYEDDPDYDPDDHPPID